VGRWPAYAAAAWSFVFAAMSFYWAAGGTAGVETLGNEIERLSEERDSGFVAEVWATGVLKVVGGLLALATLRPAWGYISGRALRIAVWVAGGLLTLYGAANLIQHGLMKAGAVDTPSGLGSEAATWHLVLWDPWWLLGGILFLLAAREASAGFAER
jgi:Protein of unknown function (DUF3995)